MKPQRHLSELPHLIPSKPKDSETYKVPRSVILDGIKRCEDTLACPDPAEHGCDIKIAKHGLQHFKEALAEKDRRGQK